MCCTTFVPLFPRIYKNQGYLLAKMQVDELFPEFGMPQQNGVALFLLDEENRPRLSNVTLNSDFRFPQTAGSQESVRCFSTEIQRVPLRVGVALPVSEHGYLQQSSLLILIFVGFLSLLFLSLFFSMIRSISSSEVWRRDGAHCRIRFQRGVSGGTSG